MSIVHGTSTQAYTHGKQTDLMLFSNFDSISILVITGVVSLVYLYAIYSVSNHSLAERLFLFLPPNKFIPNQIETVIDHAARNNLVCGIFGNRHILFNCGNGAHFLYAVHKRQINQFEIFRIAVGLACIHW